MIRLFKVYYPLRTLVLLAGEALIVWVSFLLGVRTALWMSEVGFPSPAMLQNREVLLNLKILVVTGGVLLLSHLFDLYDSSSLGVKWDQAFRLLLVLGFVTLALAVLAVRYPSVMPSNYSTVWGLIILTFALFGWRAAYSWMATRPSLRERVYVLGTGERAERLVTGLREHPGIAVVGWTGDIDGELSRDSVPPRAGTASAAQRAVRGVLEPSGLGIEAVGWTGSFQCELTREVAERSATVECAERPLRSVPGGSGAGIEAVGWTRDVESEPSRNTVASHLLRLVREKSVSRVIVAMPDRRGTLPVKALLELRLDGVKVEEATTWLERIYGKIEVEQLNPSWLIFAEGFRFSTFFRMARRWLNFSVALIGSVLSLPLLPFIALAVKLGDPGPVLYHQKRVGRRGVTFYCYKFRTMRVDAEADTGPTWAADNDPRITRVGKFLRVSRLDEIPQLWCVLKGDMHFVGPRPERPEFVERLSERFGYYYLRHAVRPGITGWAQVKHKYGNTEEDAEEKLQYDLFYIKNASLGLDLWIMFETIKIVLLGRGAQ